jgi:hypothetical protein
MEWMVIEVAVAVADVPRPHASDQWQRHRYGRLLGCTVAGVRLRSLPFSKGILGNPYSLEQD